MQVLTVSKKPTSQTCLGKIFEIAAPDWENIFLFFHETLPQVLRIFCFNVKYFKTYGF